MSCSLESLVVGEKEILAQVRKAYERCRKSGFTGDFLRLVMDRLVKTAKEVYTHTRISRNPRSEEHTSELQSLMRISYAVFCLKKKSNTTQDEKKDKENKKDILTAKK